MNFTYQEYRKLIELLQSAGFTLGIMQPASPGERKAWLRHDIDMSVDDAFSLANVEEQLGIVTTYHVMLDTAFYNVMASGTNMKLRSMADMGHDIGLHFVGHDASWDDADDDAALMADISRQCALLSEALDLEVSSFSFHRPRPQLLQKQLVVPGLNNAYRTPYFQQGAYISDSNHNWKCGDPFAFIERFEGPTLQVLTHPFWWNPEAVDPRLKLKRFVAKMADAHKATLVHDIGIAASVFGKPA